MSFADRDALDASVLDWMQRSGQSGVVGDWRTLAEARLNRELGVIEDDDPLTGTSGSRFIDTSGISIERPLRLFLTNDDGDEDPVTNTSLANLPYDQDSAEPSLWAWDRNDDQIVFNCPLDSAYSFRLISRQRFSLATGGATNWLLTNHPDVYLAAIIVWGAGYNEDLDGMILWQGLLEKTIPQIKHQIAMDKRGQLTTDPALRVLYPIRGANLDRL